jgi:hypothetical protein
MREAVMHTLLSSICRIAPLALLLTALPSAARAQKPSPTVAGRAAVLDANTIAARCLHAQRAARRGPSDPGFADGVAYAKGCGEPGADAAAAAFRTLATLSDTVALDSLTWWFSSWRDARVYAAGVRLASDETATAQSRVFAIRYLYSTMIPGAGRSSYGNLAGLGTGPCKDAGAGGEFFDGRPLPVDYVGRLRALGKRLSLSTAAPVQVRHAGMCLTIVPAGFQPLDTAP